jgi:hypothetical protein
MNNREIFAINSSEHVKFTIEDASIDIIYANGDSWSFGSELADDSKLYRDAHNYPGLIAKHLEVGLENNSFPGGSNDRTFRTTVYDIANLIANGKRPLAIITWTEIHRFELYDNNIKDWITFSHPDNTRDRELSDKIWGRYSSEEGDLSKFIAKAIALESFFKKNNVPYIMVNSASINFKACGLDKLMTYKSMMDNTNYLFAITLYGYLISFTEVEWGYSHPKENGHAMLAEFLIRQITDRYNLKL